ncbi:hypothetical protein EBZ80_21525 [bacterium]|nr:hypothetical protein [Betaproteobacteria bacterium]NDE17505.1 hypothetical protein [bacterium]
MATALALFGGLAFLGWASDKCRPPEGWEEFTARWQQPVTPTQLQVLKPAPEPKPRIINPLEQTYDAEWTTLSAP